MRFVLVDRIVGLEPGRSIEVRKNVSASEDLFEDHFPGCPVFPGAMVVEVFEQAAQLLIGATYDFQRTGSLARVSRVAFRHFVVPGDQVMARCEKRSGDNERWTIAASATVDGVPVATGTLEFALEDARGDVEARGRADRFREMARLLQEHPLRFAAVASPASPVLDPGRSG
jgi:3-hydroxyacyl-[acyl-carrier-protein] dehydratase